MVIKTLKLANGPIEFCELLDGVKYGSCGTNTTELARIVGGGKLKVCHTPGLSRTAAMVERNVVSAGVGISRPLPMVNGMELRGPRFFREVGSPCDKDLGYIHQRIRPQFVKPVLLAKYQRPTSLQLHEWLVLRCKHRFCHQGQSCARMVAPNVVGHWKL